MTTTFDAHLVDEDGFIVADSDLPAVLQALADGDHEGAWDLMGSEPSEIVLVKSGALDYRTDCGGKRMPCSYKTSDVPFSRDISSEEGPEIVALWDSAAALCYPGKA